MRAFITIPWLCFVPRRLSLTDAAAHTHTVDWLDPDNPRRAALPAVTRAALDDLEATFKPAIWGRYSWRSVLTVAFVLLFSAAVIIGIGSYALFSRRAIVSLLVIVIGILPGIWLGVQIGARSWLRRTGAAARIHACITGACCPACLHEIDTLTPRPIDTVPCTCGAVWPTLGALQSGGRSIPVAATVERAGDLAWLIPAGLLSAAFSLAIPKLPFNNQLIGALAVGLMVLLFAPFVTAGRPARALRIALALGVPPVLVTLWVFARGQGLNAVLLVGGVTVAAMVYGAGRIGPRREHRPGWGVARFVCESCGYDLRGGAGQRTTLNVCPECGYATSESPKR